MGNTKTAAETAYSYLDGRMRTAREVRKHLEGKGFGEEEITETINDLIGFRYIDDYQYALRYFEYNMEKHRGSLRASKELAERGVDPETIRYAREDFLYSSGADEFEQALSVAEKELSLKNKADCCDDKTAASIARKLDARGFDRGDIIRVLERIRRDREQ